MPRKLLVLAYYFPPMGLSGVQRASKFVKYLPDHGWQPTVVTVEPGGYFAFDQHLLRELTEREIPIERTRSLDPTRLFRPSRTVALPSEGKRKRLASLSQWVFVPDNKVGWMPFALRAAGRLLEAEPFDAILSTAPPYSSHVVAARLAKRYRLPLVLDYRDDWIGNPRHIYPTPVHRALHRRLEQYAGRAADAVVAINEPIARAIGERLGVPTTVVPQGFDGEDYPVRSERSDNKLRFVYAGVFYDLQTPDAFLNGLARLLGVRPGLREHIEARFVGLFPDRGKRLVQDLGLADVVQEVSYAAHTEAMAHVGQCDVPWLVVGHGPGQEQISTGKLYAYMGAGKPILGLVPPGVANEALSAYGASWTAHPDDSGAVDEAFRDIVRCWEDGQWPAPFEPFRAAHDRRELAGKLAAVLDRVSS